MIWRDTSLDSLEESEEPSRSDQYRSRFGSHFDARNLARTGLKIEPREFSLFLESYLWLLNEDEWDTFMVGGGLPDDWYERVQEEKRRHNEEDPPDFEEVVETQQREASPAFDYDRVRFSDAEQREHYLAAYKIVQTARQQIAGCRNRLYAITGAVIISSCLLGTLEQLHEVLKLSAGGSAMALAGAVRGNQRRRREELMKTVRDLENLIAGFEEEHLSSRDQEFYTENGIPIDVLRHAPKPIDPGDSEYTPQTPLEQFVNRTGAYIDNTVMVVQNLLT